MRTRWPSGGCVRCAQACLDRLLIVNQAHLRRVLGEDVDYYNTARPHQGLDQQAPIPFPRGPTMGPVSCRDVLDGILLGVTQLK
jgi:transposase InsO family protein